MGDIRNYLEAVFNGQIPIKRKNPQTGIEENVYYRYDDKNEELIEEKIFLGLIIGVLLIRFPCLILVLKWKLVNTGR